jgi:acyl dehydratase
VGISGAAFITKNTSKATGDAVKRTTEPHSTQGVGSVSEREAQKLYYEDFHVGQQLHSPRAYTIDRESALAFAHEYDPQDQHIDEEGAREGLFGELIVSGWQTGAVSMRLKSELELFRVHGGVVGMGLEKVRWPNPTLPGDSLKMVLTILSMRESTSRSGKGIITYKAETFNQRGGLAMEMTAAVIVSRRTV